MSHVESIIYGNSDKRIWLFQNGVLFETDPAKPKNKHLNVSNNFLVTTDDALRTYNLDLAFPGYVIPQEGGVNQGTVMRPLNFDNTQFDVAEVVATPGSYDVTNTAWGQVLVNALTTPHKLVVSGNGVTVVEDVPNDEAELTITDEKVKLYLNDVLVNALAAHLNLSTNFTATYDAATLRHDIDVAGFIPTTNRKRWGSIQWSDEPNAAGDGLFADIPLIQDGDGSDVNPGIDANGTFRHMNTGGEDNDHIGYGTDAPMTRLAFNPHFYCSFKLPVLATYRLFIGFHSADVPDSDNDFLNDQSGFAFTIQKDNDPDPPDDFYYIRRNDGTGATVEVSTAVADVANTMVTFEIIGEATPTPRWGWNINGGATVWYTTDIPITTTDLRFMIRVEEQGGTEQEFDLYYAYIEQAA